MKTFKNFFYTNLITEKTNKNDGFNEKFYTVIEVQVFNNNVDEADRKARTIALKNNTTLAGGYFNENCKPYNFDTNYTNLKCAKNTKIQPYSKHDLFIIDLIEAEKNMKFEVFV